MTFLPLLTLGVLGPFISARTIEAEVTNHTVQLIRQVQKNIEFYVREMEGVASIVTEDPDVQVFFDPASDFYLALFSEFYRVAGQVHQDLP